MAFVLWRREAKIQIRQNNGLNTEGGSTELNGPDMSCDISILLY